MPIAVNYTERAMRAYSDEVSRVDVVGEDGCLEKAIEYFGLRVARGTALTYHDLENNTISGVEQQFRKYCKGHKKCIEIGTFRGLSSVILAHYCEKVRTIDIQIFDEAFYLWRYFGVDKKIDYINVVNKQTKKKAIEDFGTFDFAFIDGLHTYEGVKEDFELLQHCGNILFHDYDSKMEQCQGVKKLVDELPKEEITIDVPFALWKSTKI